MRTTFPKLDIGLLSADHEDDLMISRFSKYLDEHQNLVFPHRHSFYQLVLFTEGGGSHIIDFNHFPVTPGQIYFMLPGQVHDWLFEGEMEGYVINFSESFFRSFLFHPDYLETFSFFSGEPADGVFVLNAAVQQLIIPIFEAMLTQTEQALELEKDMLRVMLLQVFLHLEQSGLASQHRSKSTHKNQVVRAFQKLINQHFREQRLPGAYASMLHVTPNHLNALCKEHLGIQAGALIRNRIVLEIKRQLINLDLTVSEIAYQLHFSDTSYFTKFFKKETGYTPEEFRASASPA